MRFFRKTVLVPQRIIVCSIAVPLLLVFLVNETSQNMDSKTLSAAVTQFSAKFCNELVKDKSVVSSPLSAEFVLALLTLGATDDVHTELLTSLGIPDDDSIRSGFTLVSTQLRALKRVTLNAANKVYIMEGPYDLNAALKEDAVKVFDADFQKLDFSNGNAAADVINKWVESKTNERIKDLLSGDSLSSDTRLVLVNALYFKGTWAKQFDPHMTSVHPFHVDAATTVEVPMMYKEDKFRYGESQYLNAQLLQLDYVGGEASMVIILPSEVTGLAGVLDKLAAGWDLGAELDRMHTTKVQVTLPKFKIETTIDLTQVLPQLGINSIFDPNNKGLCKLLNVPTSLFVSNAIQKAFIEVNEEGAEAAVATVMGVAFCAAIVDFTPVPRFTADRPFLALIVTHGTPHFVATYRGE